MTKEEKKEYLKKYRNEHRGELSAKNKAWRDSNKEELKEKRRAYYLKNKDRILESCKERYTEKTEEIRAKHKEYTKKNADKISAFNRSDRGREKWRKYEKENRDRRNQEKREWRKANPGRAYSAYRKYILVHPENKRTWEARRRARKSGAEGSHSTEEWNNILMSCNGTCVYCGCAEATTRDHDIPLSCGGSDSIENIVPACKSCNSSKGALTGDEFRVKRMVA